MKKIISKLISLTAAAAMVFTLVPEAISAGAAGNGNLFFTFEATSSVLNSGIGGNYTVEYGESEYNGGMNKSADFTVAQAAVDSNASDNWNKMSIFAINYSVNNAENGWKRYNLANCQDGSLRLWIKVPRAAELTIVLQNANEPYDYYTTNVSVGAEEAGIFTAIEVPYADFHLGSMYSAVDLNGAPPLIECGKVIVTCNYANDTANSMWFGTGETLTMGSLEFWDGPISETEPDEGEEVYGTLKDKVEAEEGIYGERSGKSGNFDIVYSHDASYSDSTGMSAAAFTFTAAGASGNAGIQINPRGEKAGWKSWYLNEENGYFRFWINAPKAVTLTFTVQETKNYASYSYKTQLSASDVGRFTAVDIPVSVYSSIIADDSSRVNLFYIFFNDGDVKMNEGDTVVVGRTELWSGRPEGGEEPGTGEYTVTTTVNSGSYGTATGGGVYADGETAHLLADAASGYHFEKWNINGTDYYDNPLDYTVTGNATATAIFAPDVPAEAEIVVSVNCVGDPGVMSLGNGDKAYLWKTPEYFTETTKTYSGYVGRFSVADDADLNVFYDDWGKSATSIMYMINDYNSIDFNAYASSGVIRFWIRAEKEMNFALGIKVNNSSYSQYCVERTYPEKYVGKFIPIDIPISELVSMGYKPQSEKIVQFVLRRADSATQESGKYLLKGDELDLGTVELWSSAPEVPDLENEICTVEISSNKADAGTVSGAGEYEYGKEVTLTASAENGYRFAGWFIGKKFVTDASVSFIASSSINVSAVYAGENESVIIFEDHIGAVIAVETAENGEKAENVSIPQIPQRYGYITEAWKNFDSQTVISGDITVSPEYIKDETVKAEITVINGTVQSAETEASESGIFTFEEQVTVNCADDSFSYWSVGGAAVSTQNPYTFFTTGDMTVEAVCGTEPETSDIVHMNDYSLAERGEDGFFSITSYGSVQINADDELIEYGFLVAKGDQRGNKDNFVINSTEISYVKVPVTSTGSNQFMLTVDKVPEGTVRSIRAYTAVLSGAKIEYYYSDTVVKAKASDSNTVTGLDYMVLNSDYVNGLDEDEAISFLETAKYYEGDTTRLQAAMQKAASGEEVTIAFLGGSITTGSNSCRTETSGTDGSAKDKLLNAYHKYVKDWWETTFPNANIVYVTAGEAGTGSTFAVYRLKHQILDYAPDVVFNDSAVNEGGSAEEKECYESVLRALLGSENAPAVIDLGFAFESGSNSQHIHKDYCQNYGVPIVSYQDSVKSAISNGSITWDEISNDNVHPNKEGHKIAADIINYYLSTVYMSLPQEPVTVNTELPAPVGNARYSDADMYNRDSADTCTKITLIDNKGFVSSDVLWGVPDMSDQPSDYYFYSNAARNQGWKTGTAGDYMEFSITARECSIRYSDPGNTTSVFNVYVDDELYQSVTSDGSWSQKVLKVFENESGDSTHTIRIEAVSGSVKLASLTCSSWNG